MTTETKVEAVAWIGPLGQLIKNYRFQARVNGLPDHGDLSTYTALYHQSALDALRGEVERWKSRYDDAMQARADEQKRADAAERRVAECLKLADVLDLVSRSPDVTIPQWHRLAGIADEFRDALTKESP